MRTVKKAGVRFDKVGANNSPLLSKVINNYPNKGHHQEPSHQSVKEEDDQDTITACMSTVNYKFMSPFLSLSLCPFSHYILVPVLYVNDLNHLTANSSKSKCDDTGLNSAMFLKFFI